ncbi:hypothetical protein [Mesorhizobium huakuii]|uniref:Uncharacterized protein n=1 Tax=Mesorhizobium huakuii TaxID=28104 RepID=A0A7G6T0S5_9HYPH|nr:hypothetical protein [Mesorhizobium huakuii]QND60357.1 hypothetical protein HB778_30285 [Mesorhizobium huakuii]
MSVQPAAAAQPGPRPAQVEEIPSIDAIVQAEQNYINDDIQRLYAEFNRNKDMLERKRGQLKRYEEIIAAHRAFEKTLETNVAKLKQLLVARQQVHFDMMQDSL